MGDEEASPEPVALERDDNADPARFDSVVQSLRDFAEPTGALQVLRAAMAQARSQPDAEFQAKFPGFLKQATLALLSHENLEGDMPDAVNGFILEAIDFCVGTLQTDSVPQAELLAECLDYKKLLYREHGGSGAAGVDADSDGDTMVWRQSLDFADRVDALKTNWDNVKHWTTAQIVETNPANHMVKLRYDNAYDSEDRWVAKLSDEIAPHKTKTVQAAAKLKQWKDSLVPGQWVDAQDHTFKHWYNAQIKQRKSAEEYAALEQRQWTNQRQWNHSQQEPSAHVTVVMNGVEKESTWISVDSSRLARFGTRAGGAAAHFDDMDDSEDPDAPDVFACDHGKSYGCPSLVAAVNRFGTAGGYEAIIRRLHAAGPPPRDEAEPEPEPEPETQPARADEMSAETATAVDSVAATAAGTDLARYESLNLDTLRRKVAEKEATLVTLQVEGDSVPPEAAIGVEAEIKQLMEIISQREQQLSAAAAAADCPEATAPPGAAASVENVRAFIDLMVNTRMLLAKPFAHRYIPKFCQAVRANFNHLSDDQVRGVTASGHEKMLQGVTTILERLFTSRDIFQTTELLSLDVALKCFRCPLMEKKIFGFKIILELLDNAKWAKSGWVTTIYMVEWLLKENVPQEIFCGRQTLVQIVERSADVMKYIIIERKLTKQHLEMVWQTSAVAIEEVVRLAIYKLLKDLSVHLRDDELEFIFSQVAAIAPPKLLEPTVTLVFDLAKSAAYKVPALASRALALLWNWMVDTSQTTPVIATLAETKLIDLAAQCYNMRDQKEPLMAKCVEFLSRSDSSPQCLKILWKVADTMQQNKTWTEVRTKQAAVETLQNSHDLLTVFFDDFIRYKHRAKDFVPKSPTSAQAATTRSPSSKPGIPPVDTAQNTSMSLDECIVCSRMPHLQQIELRLNVLTFILRNSSLQLSAEQVAILWDSGIADMSVSHTEREMVYKWLKNACAKTVYTAMEPTAAAELFMAKLANASADWCSRMTPQGFTCFTRFFILTNESSKNLVRDGVGDGNMEKEFAFQVLRLPTTLEGYECVWNILLHATDDKVVVECIGLLNSVHEILAPELIQSLGQIRGQYVDTTMAHMRRLMSEVDTRGIGRCVALLETLLSRSEVNGTCGLTSHRCRLRSAEISIRLQSLIKVPNLQYPAKVTRSVRTSMSVWELRVLIGTEANYFPEQVRLFMKGKEIPYTSNAKTLEEVGVTNNELLSINTRPPPPKPKVMLVDSNGDMVPEFRSIITSWFQDFSANGMMTRQECAAFIRSCRGDSCQWDDARIQAIYRIYDTDNDDILKEEDFLRIYSEKASTHAGQAVVWENLETRGWGHDLKQKARIYTPDPEAEAQQCKLLPRYLLSLNAEYFDLLLELLDLGGDTLDKVWGLVMTLPTQESVSRDLTSLSAVDDTGAGWTNLLNPQSTFRLLYALQVVSALIQSGDEIVTEAEMSEEVRTGRAWHQAFLAKGGFQHIHSLVVSGAIELVSPLHKQCMATLLRVERHFVLGALASEVSPVAAGAAAESGTASQPESEGAAELILEAEPAPLDADESLDHWLEKPSAAIASMCSGILKGVDLEVLQQTIVGLIVNVTATEVSKEGASIVQNALQLWVGAVMNSQSLLESFFSLEQSRSTVLSLMFCSTSALVRSEFGQAIRLICVQSKSEPPAKVWFLRLLVDSIPQTDGISAVPECEEFFELLCALVKDTPVDSADFGFSSKLTSLFAQLESYPYTEKAAEPTPDNLLVGIMALACVLLEKQPLYIAQNDMRPLLHRLFDNGLFDSCESLEHDADLSPPKFKSLASRRAAFKLIWTIVKESPELLTYLWQACFVPLQKRFNGIDCFDYNPSLDTKSGTGFVGLRNLGCTCYMNSMMQQFFMVENMRYGVLSVTQNVDEADDTTDSILGQLQRIFGFLEASDRQDRTTVGLCQAYKDMDGNPINVNIQQDAQEFLNFFFDKIEARIKGTPQEKLLDRLFGGTFAMQLRSKEKNFFRQKSEFYNSISLDVQNRKDIYDAFEKWTAWETVTDFKIEETGDVVDVDKRSCLNDLPRTMIIHLKRFVFSYETFVTEKTNNEISFPTRFNVEPYTAEGLSRREDAKDNAEKKAAPEAGQAGDAKGASTSAAPVAASTPNRDDDENIAPPAHPLEYYDYDLVGVVVHSGNADSGHYYSFIKKRDTGQWLRFDDSIVSPFDPEELPQECFGGVQVVKEENQYGFTTTKHLERVKNAYMLVYDRVWKDVGQDPDETARELQIMRDMAQGIKQAVWEDNRKFFFDRRVFHPDFFDFISNVVSKLEVPDAIDYSADLSTGLAQQSADLIFCATKFLLETVSRAQENGQMPKLTDAICAMYEKNVAAGKLFLERYTDDMKAFSELILRCPDKTVRSCVQKLLSAILRTVAAAETAVWDEQETAELLGGVKQEATDGATNVDVAVAVADGADSPATSMAALEQRPRSRARHFMERFALLLPHVEKMWMRFEQYWAVWQHWCAQGDAEAKLMMDHFGLWRLVDLYLGDRSPLPLCEGQTRVKMGKANLRPVFGPLVSCVCTLTTMALRLETAGETYPVDQRDGMMVRLPEFFEQALSRIRTQDTTTVVKEADVPTEVGAMAAALTKNNQEMTDIIIRVLQHGIDRVDYEDLQPYCDVLSHFFAIEDTLQYYRMEKMFSRANGSSHDLGILALIAKYKQNKSQGPSRYAYVLVKQLLSLTKTNLAFDQFLGTVRSPVPHSTVAVNATGAATTVPVEAPTFVSWAGEFLKEFQADTLSMDSKTAVDRERRDSATLTLEEFVAFQARASAYEAPVPSNRQVWQQKKEDEQGGTRQMVSLTLLETTFEPGPKAVRLTLIADSTVPFVATVEARGPPQVNEEGTVQCNYNFQPLTISIPANAKAAVLCVMHKRDPTLDWGEVKLSWSWSSLGKR